MKKAPKIVYMGTPAFAVAPLKELLEKGYDIAAIVTAPDKSSGRGLAVNSSEVKKFAENMAIPVFQPISLKDETFQENLKALNADLFIVVAFRMLPKSVWSMPELGTFNLHASLLPDYRGAAPINWVLINGETKTGVTTFLLDEQIDTGDILFQQECMITPEDNFGSLHDKLMNIGTDLVIKTVEALAEGKHKRKVQASMERGIENTHSAPKLTKETGRIDWNKSTDCINNLVRGLSPYPAAHSEFVGGSVVLPVKIYKGNIIKASHSLAPGTIDSDGKKYIKAACSDGFFEISELQLAGKKRLSVKEFLAGFRNIENFKLS